MKVKFLETYTVQAKGGQTFVSGEVYDLDESSARHFLNKKRCEVFIEKPLEPQITDAEQPEVLNDATSLEESNAPIEEEVKNLLPLQKRKVSFRKEG